MAAVAAPTLELTDDQKRWVVAGIALNKVVISCIRPLVKDVVEKEYEDLKKSHAIDTQTFGRHCITFPSSPAGPHFIYKNINGNESITTGRPNFDYKIQQGVDLARLCLKTHMAKFGAFDETCDGSAVLMLLGCVPSFSLATQAAANNVRSQVRNEWAHCNYNEWDETNFHNCFRYMELLLNTMGLADAEIELKEWETKGMTVCMSSPDQALAIRLVQEEAAKLLLEFEKVTCLAADELKRIKDALTGNNEKLMQRMDQMEASMMGRFDSIQDSIESTKEQVEKVQEKLEEVTSALQKSTITNLTRAFLNIHFDHAGTTSTSGHAEPVSKPCYDEEVMHAIVAAFLKKINSMDEPHRPREKHRLLMHLLDFGVEHVQSAETNSLCITVRCPTTLLFPGSYFYSSVIGVKMTPLRSKIFFTPPRE